MTANVLTVDTRVRGGFRDLESTWEPTIGAPYALPSFTTGTRANFQVSMNVLRLHDLVYNTVESVTAVRTAGFATNSELARVWIVRRGGWVLGDERGTEHQVPAGRLLVRLGPMSHLHAEPATSTEFLALPVEALGTRSRSASGAASAPEARLLLAQARMIRECVAELSPAGLLAARNTLVELMRGLVHGGVDGAEPQVAPALVEAARKLLEQRLTRPDLSTSVLAAELNVSVRTLQRSFAAEGETVARYVRERRLVEARQALTGPGEQFSISEIAARWQFSDASHFIRLFRRRYGLTPHEFRRSLQDRGHVN